MDNLNPLGLPSELVFSTDALQQELCLDNPTDRTFLFKIKSTDRDMLELRHFEGVVNAGARLPISITLKQVDPLREKKIKLQVQWVEVPKESKERRIDSFAKSELKSKQIIVVEKEGAAHRSVVLPKPETPAIVETISAPALQPLEASIVQKSQAEDEILQALREKNRLLQSQHDELTREYNAVAVAKQKQTSEKKGNGPMLLLVLFAVFLGVYYCGRLLTDL